MHRDVQCPFEALKKSCCNNQNINFCFINNICSFVFIKTQSPHRYHNCFVVMKHRLRMASCTENRDHNLSMASRGQLLFLLQFFPPKILNCSFIVLYCSLSYVSWLWLYLFLCTEYSFTYAFLFFYFLIYSITPFYLKKSILA